MSVIPGQNVDQVTQEELAAGLAGKANTAHGHAIGDVSGLSSALSDRVLTTDPRLSDARTPLAHSHAISDINGLQDALDSKQGVEASVIEIPAIAPGQTLLFSEEFDQTGWGPGWTNTTNSGLVVANVNAGPYVRDANGNVVRKARAVKKAIAEITTGYTMPTATWTFPNTDDAYVVSFWVRPAHFSQGFRDLISLRDSFGNTLDSCRVTVDVTAINQFRFTFQTYGGSTVNTEWLPCGEWYRVWLAVRKIEGRAWFVQDSSGVIRRYAAAFNTPNWPASQNVGFPVASIPAFQPIFSGQISAFRVYRATNLVTAMDGPVDYVWPVNSEFEVDPIDGSDTNLNGPWATVDKAIQSCNDCIVMGSTNAFSVNGSKVGLNDLTTIESRKKFVGEYMRGNVSHVAGDTIRIKSGLHRLTTQTIVAHSPGVKWLGEDGCEIRSTKILTGGTWSAPDAAFPRAWRYSVTQAPKSVLYLPGMKALMPLFAANEATAKGYLNTFPYSTWMSSAGELWMGLPAGMNPSQVVGAPDYEISTIQALGVADGCYLVNLTMTGLSEINYQAGSTDRVDALYGVSITGQPFISIIEDCEANGYTKHVFAFATARNDSLTIWNRPRYGGQPPGIPVTQPWAGVGNGDYSPLVDYSSLDTVDGKIVTAYLNPITSERGFVAVPGSDKGVTWNATDHRTPYYTHTAGGPEQPFACTIFAFAGACPTNFFGTGTPPVATPVSHQEFVLLQNSLIP